MTPRRFPPPWSIEEQTESFIVKDATGLPIAYVYFEDEPQRQMSMRRLSRDEAFLLAVNIAKLPSVPRSILKDIPSRQIQPLGTIERRTKRRVRPAIGSQTAQQGRGAADCGEYCQAARITGPGK